MECNRKTQIKRDNKTQIKRSQIRRPEIVLGAASSRIRRDGGQDGLVACAALHLPHDKKRREGNHFVHAELAPPAGFQTQGGSCHGDLLDGHELRGEARRPTEEPSREKESGAHRCSPRPAWAQKVRSSDKVAEYVRRGLIASIPNFDYMQAQALPEVPQMPYANANEAAQALSAGLPENSCFKFGSKKNRRKHRK